MSSNLDQALAQSRIDYQNEQNRRDFESAQLASVISFSLREANNSKNSKKSDIKNSLDAGDAKRSAEQIAAEQRLANQHAANQQRLTNQRTADANRLAGEKKDSESQRSLVNPAINGNPNRPSAAGSPNARVVDAPLLIFTKINYVEVNIGATQNNRPAPPARPFAPPGHTGIHPRFGATGQGPGCGLKKGHHKHKH